jgi:hypothetical protein
MCTVSIFLKLKSQLVVLYSAGVAGNSLHSVFTSKDDELVFPHSYGKKTDELLFLTAGISYLKLYYYILSSPCSQQ